jgi:hypothetical protein
MAGHLGPKVPRRPGLTVIVAALALAESQLKTISLSVSIAFAVAALAMFAIGLHLARQSINRSQAAILVLQPGDASPF